MDFDEYRRRGKEMVDYIADYLENIRDRKVFPSVKPGYMRNLLPESAPIEGENWEKIFNDIERVIMPGVTHWQSPHMHAYFPALNSFPSLLGDMLADAINCLGFTWASSPACTELEIIVMNWLGKMIGLPDTFLHLNSNSKGGGVIQTTASEATLVCLLAGRSQAIQRFHEKTPGLQDAEINARLVAYCSDQAHSSIEKSALIGLVRMRYIESDEKLSMRGGPLREAVEDDIKQGLIPFWVCATLGTTGACAFDNLTEIGDVCQDYKLWLHVDAAYAGSALICSEFRTWLKGIEKADSIAFNPSKWLMVHFDCTAMWVKDCTAVHRTFNVEPLYLQHENSGLAIDYMHWQIPLSKRFRSLKLWFVLRSYGIKGLQKHIREGVRMAQKFEALVLADHRFEIPAERHLGMVVFRIKGENDLTERLLKRLNNRGNLHCVPASLKGKYVIRFTVTSTRTSVDDIIADWSEIRQVATEILNELNIKHIDRAKVPLKDIREKNEAFGSSLLLANSPMSPKIVNGSFAAIFDADEFLSKAYAGFRIAHQDSPSMRRRVRGILMSGKQFSLDSRMDLVAHSCVDSGTASNKSGSIREDNEDNWEVYEYLRTSTMIPLIPTSIMSPIQLSLTETKENKNMNLLTKQLTTISEKPILIQIQNNINATTSNILSVNYENYAIDRIVFAHNFNELISSQCCDTKAYHHQCNFSTASLSLQKSDFFEPNHKTTNDDNDDNEIFKQIPVQSNENQMKFNTTNIYHGKRYLLDPITTAEQYFLNLNYPVKSDDIETIKNYENLQEFESIFQLIPSSFETEEVCSEESFTNCYSLCNSRLCQSAEEAQNNTLPQCNINSSISNNIINNYNHKHQTTIFPKVRVRVIDEHNQRSRTSFDDDSSSFDENETNNSINTLQSSLACNSNNNNNSNNSSSDLEKLSSIELCSSLDCCNLPSPLSVTTTAPPATVPSTATTDGIIVSSDEWTIVQPFLYETPTTFTSLSSSSSSPSSSSSTKNYCKKCGHYPLRDSDSSNTILSLSSSSAGEL